MTDSKIDPDNTRQSFSNICLAIHGGAGEFRQEHMTPGWEEQYSEGLKAALEAGYSVLQQGGSALDTVEAAVQTLEDCPSFNSGKGSCFTCEGKIEMDAAMMDGKTRMAGAIASVTNIKNPITAARAVMEKTQHVLLVGQGAEKFAWEAGLEIVDPTYFQTEHQWAKFQRILAEESEKLQTTAATACNTTVSPADKKFGTVGAVAVDAQGNVAAATSTGGTFNKKFGRVGDSPLIGCGTYADNATCAISTTGHGEFFIRHVAAYDVSALMKYKGLTLAEAANHVIHDILLPANGRGGLIAIDAAGNCALPFNSTGMFRGCITRDGKAHVPNYAK